MQIYVCVICKVDTPPLYALISEHRLIFEAVVSRSVDITKLQQCQLLACTDCQHLIQTMLVFKKTALVGVNHLLNLLSLARAQPTPAPESPDPLEVHVKNESEDETDVKPYLFIEVEPERFSFRPEVQKPAKVEPVSSATESAESFGLDPEDHIAVHSVNKIELVEQDGAVAVDSPRQAVTVVNRNENMPVPFVDQRLVPIIQGRGATLVGRGTITAGRGAVTAGRGVVTAGREVVTVGRGAFTVGRGAVTVGRGTVTVRSGAASVGRGAAAIGRGGGKNHVRLVALQQETPEMPKLQPISGSSHSAGTADATQPVPPKMPRLQPISSGSDRSGTTDEAPATQTKKKKRSKSNPDSCCFYVLKDYEVASERYATRKSEKYANAEFRCEPCLQTFASADAVEMHAKLHLPSAGPFKCSICTQYVPDMKELSAHRRLHSVRYRCCYCTFITPVKIMAEIHTCDPKDLLDVEVIRRRHRTRYRYPKSIKCKECTAGFVDDVALARHVAKRHSGPAEPIDCKECGKTFQSKYSLKKHSHLHLRKHKLLENVLESLNPETFCADCKVPFPTRASYRVHRQSLKHSNKDDWKFECDYCGKKCFDKFAMALHIKAMHTNERRFKCEKCPRAFVSRITLQNHAETHLDKRPRPYVCERCGKSFLHKPSLEQHMNTHYGLRPYKCKLCPATFSFSGAVYTHTKLKHLKIKMAWKKKPSKKGQKKTKEKEVESVDSEKS